MKSCRNEDDAAAGTIGMGVPGECSMSCCGFQEVWESGLDSVVGAQDINVNDRFEGVCGKLVHGRQEITCCSSTGQTVSFINL